MRGRIDRGSPASQGGRPGAQDAGRRRAGSGSRGRGAPCRGAMGSAGRAVPRRPRSPRPRAAAARSRPSRASFRAGAAVPLATIPCGLDKLREEPPELDGRRPRPACAATSLDADLLVVRVPAHPRMILMKAAFMAGGLVVPLDGSEQSLWEEFYLCQEVQQSFYGLTLWPWAADRVGPGPVPDDPPELPGDRGGRVRSRERRIRRGPREAGRGPRGRVRRLRRAPPPRRTSWRSASLEI